MGSLVHIEGRAAEALVNKIGEAVTGITKPWQIRRVARAEAEKTIENAKAEAKAVIIKQQAELVAKGMDSVYAQRFIAEEIKKQINMDRIIEKAIPQLKEDARPENMDNDWMAHFFDRCRIISDEDVQETWSRILAGEANVPGTFSKKTLDCLQSLEMDDAKVFSALRSFLICVEGKLVACVYEPTNDIYGSIGKGFGKLQQLESIGLLTVVFSAVGGGPCVEILKGKINIIEYFNQKIKIVNQNDDDIKLKVGYVRLTRTGRELAEICHANPVPEFINYAMGKWEHNSNIIVELIK